MRFSEMGSAPGEEAVEMAGSNLVTTQTVDQTVAGSEHGTHFAEASSPGERPSNRIAQYRDVIHHLMRQTSLSY